MFNFFCKRLLTSMKSADVDIRREGADWSCSPVSASQVCFSLSSAPAGTTIIQNAWITSGCFSINGRPSHKSFFLQARILLTNHNPLNLYLPTPGSLWSPGNEGLSSPTFKSSLWSDVQLWLGLLSSEHELICRTMPLAYYVEGLALCKHRPSCFPEHTKQEEEIQVTHLHFLDRSY